MSKEKINKSPDVAKATSSNHRQQIREEVVEELGKEWYGEGDKIVRINELNTVLETIDLAISKTIEWKEKQFKKALREQELRLAEEYKNLLKKASPKTKPIITVAWSIYQEKLDKVKAAVAEQDIETDEADGAE